MDDMVEILKLRIENMTEASTANQSTVNDISNAMNIYKENIANIIKDTTQINEVSNSMLELANEYIIINIQCNFLYSYYLI